MAVKELNLLMTYPVKWSIYKVMRDYIQNFYDAIGFNRFSDDFKYFYNEEKKELVMISQVDFDKEWLLYIGTSSKRGTDTGYAGKFGEGFKIASLVAYRDFHLSVTMESRTWKIKVTEKEKKIDNKSVFCLAYDITKQPAIEGARLVLDGVDKENYEIFLSVLKDFYYIENPLFGELIAENDSCAVYGTKKTEKGVYRRGRVYVGYQYRESICFPIIVCNHTYSVSGDDRDRDHLNSRQTEECVMDVIDQLDSAQAFEVLQRLRKFWNGNRRDGCKISPKEIVERLIEIASSNDEVKDKFKAMYDEEVVADITTNYWLSDHKVRIAKLWFRDSKYYGKRAVVLPEFVDMGIKDIHMMCREANGYEVTEEPGNREWKFISLLEKVATKYFSDIYQYDELPYCMMFTKTDLALEGLAETRKLRTKSRNAFGLTTKRKIDTVYLLKDVLWGDSFGTALSVYLHELLHQYGGDSSMQFHKALYIMNMRMLEKAEELKVYSERWKRIHKRGGRKHA